MKAKTTITGLVLAVVLLGGLLTAAFNFFTQMNLTTTPQLDPETQTFIQQEQNVSNQIGEQVRGAYESLTNISITNPVSWVIGASAIVGVLTTVLGAIPATLTTSLTGIAKFFGVPMWVVTLITTVVLVWIVLRVVSWLAGRDEL